MHESPKAAIYLSPYYSTRFGDLLFRQIEGDKLYRDIKEELDE
jgi:hypothetical protein